MANKNAKDNIINKFGLKLSGSKAEIELDKLKKENALLKKTLAEMTNQKSKLPDSDEGKLLERIISLETIREKNSQQLLAKDQEIARLRQQLLSKGGEIVASLQSQLDQKAKEAERREDLVRSLSEETRSVKNKLAAISAKCEELENRHQGKDPGAQGSQADGQGAPVDVATLQEHLRDALEKNQHWLVYDQQRESYVKAVLARTAELEQQLNQANSAPQHQHKGPSSHDDQSAQMQEHYDKLLLKAKKDLETLREQLAQGQAEVMEFRRRYEETARELEAVTEQLAQGQAEVREFRRRYEETARELEAVTDQLREERFSNRQSAEEERRAAHERSERLKAELDNVDARLAEERKRSADLLLQTQMTAKDFENERLDRQSLQYQLHKVLKELHKAREQITKLESSKQQRESRFSEPASCSRAEFERLSIDDPYSHHSSPSKIPSLLDESFLECPNCRTQYPASQHRELLVHIDYCLNQSN